MVKRLFFILAMLCGLTLPLIADNIEKAEDAYGKGDYHRAINIYNDIIQKNGESVELLYNLGNAYLKSGDYGKAMLNYKRALLLDPSDKSLKNNIVYLKGKVDDNNKAETKGKKISVQEDDKPFFTKLKDYIVFSFSINTWALWSGVSFVVTVLLLALYIFGGEVLVRKIGFFGSIVTFAISLLTLLFAFMSVSGRNSVSKGVVTSYKVKLSEAPSETAKQNKYPLTRGTVLEVIDTDSSPDEEDETSKDKWYKVQLNSDYSGWIKSEDFEII